MTFLRERSCEDTLKIIQPYTRECGITRVACLTGLDQIGIPVYTGIRPLSKSLTTSQGKGLTNAAAQCGAIMESVEVFFAEEIEPLHQQLSVQELQRQGRRYLHPNLFSHGVNFQNDNRAFSWISAQNELGEKCLLPWAAVSQNTTHQDVILMATNSTGLASGNSHVEAQFYALLECLEREVDEGGVKQMVQKMPNFPGLSEILAVCEVSLFYYPNIFNLPIFECQLQAKNPFSNQAICCGYAAHLDKELSLTRAVFEAVQTRMTVIAGSRDDLTSKDYRRERYIQRVQPFETIEFSAIPTHPIENLQSGLMQLYTLIGSCGYKIWNCPLHVSEMVILKSFLLSIENDIEC